MAGLTATFGGRIDSMPGLTGLWHGARPLEHPVERRLPPSRPVADARHKAARRDDRRRRQVKSGVPMAVSRTEGKRMAVAEAREATAQLEEQRDRSRRPGTPPAVPRPRKVPVLDVPLVEVTYDRVL